MKRLPTTLFTSPKTLYPSTTQALPKHYLRPSLVQLCSMGMARAWVERGKDGRSW